MAHTTADPSGVTAMLRWSRDRVPALLLIAVPAGGQAGIVVVHGGTLSWLLLTSGLSLAVVVAIGVILVGSGAVSRGGELLSVSVGTLSRQRTRAVQQSAVLQDLVENLRHSADAQATTSARLLSELVRSEEGTRAALAAELHDTVAQTLSAAIIGLRRSEPWAREEARETLQDAENELRAVLSRIRPPELVDGDLARAIADLCDDLLIRYDTPVAVTWEAPSLSLPLPVAVLVYRCAQEALLNAVEHAEGAGLRLELRALTTTDGGELEMLVSDEGLGFDPSTVVSTGGRHLGLRLLRDRARLVGGSLAVTSSPGRGTQVALSIPLSRSGSGATEAALWGVHELSVVR